MGVFKKRRRKESVGSINAAAHRLSGRTNIPIDTLMVLIEEAVFFFLPPILISFRINLFCSHILDVRHATGLIEMREVLYVPHDLMWSPDRLEDWN